MSLGNQEKQKRDNTWFLAVGLAMTVGLIAIILYAVEERSSRVFAVELLVSLAATMVGAMGGFVFGVPKSVATSQPTPGTEYQGNTNLEQISDWLTKILVGAGLVELKNIPSALDAFGSKFIGNEALGKFGWVASSSIVIAYSGCGFLLAYLWARIYMVRELEDRELRKKGLLPPPTTGTDQSPTVTEAGEGAHLETPPASTTTLATPPADQQPEQAEGSRNPVAI
jgi:hypothetical protein